MNAPLYYRRDGTPIEDTLEWARLFEDRAYHIVKQTTLPGGRKWVSTVWLGINHAFGDGPPLIFETMVFGVKDLSRYTFGGRTHVCQRDYDQRRWSTEAEAIAGHAALCRFWRGNHAARRKHKV